MVLLKPEKLFTCAICGKQFPEAETVLLGGVRYCLYHPKVMKEWERRLKGLTKNILKEILSRKEEEK